MNTTLLYLTDNVVSSAALIDDLKTHQLQLCWESLTQPLNILLPKIQSHHLVVFDIHQQLKPLLEILSKIQDRGLAHTLVLGPSDQEQDCLDAFTAGVDDYLKRPFILAECIARMKALMRRSQQPQDQNLLAHGDLVVNCLTRQAVLAHQPMELTNTQFNLLELFLRNPGRVLSKEQLTEYSLGRKYTAYDRSIDVHVSHLRQKLNADHQDESWIQTIRGYGYAFIAKG